MDSIWERADTKMKNMNKKIAIIGFGHIGKALMKGLISGGLKQENILVSNNSSENKKVVEKSDWIIFAVKPLVMESVISELKDFIADKLIFSLAAGVRISSLEKYAGNKKQKIIRLMPNIPIAIGEGVIGFYANKNVSLDEKNAAMKLISTLGKVVDCKTEDDFDAINIISACGPAVVAYLITMLSKSGEKFGLSKNVAEKIALQTFAGTLSYLKQTQQTPLELQKSVATKSGATEQVIQNLDKEKILQKFVKSLDKGYAKIKKLNSSTSIE